MSDNPQEFIYVSEIREYGPDYEYRISLQERDNKLIIHHQKLYEGGWLTTHSIGITKKDLSDMFNVLKN